MEGSRESNKEDKGILKSPQQPTTYRDFGGFWASK